MSNPISDIVEFLRGRIASGDLSTESVRAYLERIAAKANDLATKRVDPLYSEMDKIFAKTILDNIDELVSRCTEPKNDQA